MGERLTSPNADTKITHVSEVGQAEMAAHLLLAEDHGRSGPPTGGAYPSSVAKTLSLHPESRSLKSRCRHSKMRLLAFDFRRSEAPC